MRLLDVHTLQLREFIDNIPDYAILSHTWEEEEVAFSDLSELDRAKEKKGFEKISKACEQAIRDKFDWIWIDTCCIDKSSSSELSEAINSMYSWYKKSSKCYAFLADVGNVRENFKDSKWFTRAWTLQELLAPSTIGGNGGTGFEFFSKNWRSLGSKAGLCSSISACTGIAKEYLMGRSLDSASISMRMSWAAERRATRAEDIAYSLLGIFDVNMPLLYGEGKLKAFRRLQEEIMKISEDETLFAWESMELAVDASSGDALASDPKDFSESRDLVPYASEDPVIPYGLTHRGLRIGLQIHLYSEAIHPLRSPVMIRSPSSFQLHAAVLRCHVAHDYHHVVVIPLIHLTANLYVRDTATNVGLLPTRLLSQFRPIDEVYIRNSRIPSISNSISRRFGFLIRNLPAGFAIANAAPKESWNSKDRIVQGESNAQGLRSWHSTLELSAFLHLPPQPMKYRIFLSLGCRQERGDSEVKYWCHLDDVLWKPGRESLEYFHRNAWPKSPRWEVSKFWDSDAKEHQLKLRVSVSPEKVFGQQMFIVDVDSMGKDSLAVVLDRTTQVSPAGPT